MQCFYFWPTLLRFCKTSEADVDHNSQTLSVRSLRLQLGPSIAHIFTTTVSRLLSGMSIHSFSRSLQICLYFQKYSLNLRQLHPDRENDCDNSYFNMVQKTSTTIQNASLSCRPYEHQPESLINNKTVNIF
eukprot:Awhi_evm1s13094